MSDYPEEIELDEESEEFIFLKNHSRLIKILAEIEKPVILTAKLLFDGDQKQWHNFVDLFFPELGVRKLINVKNGNFYVVPGRGGKKELMKMLDFFMVDTPDSWSEFLKLQAKKRYNAPMNIAAKAESGVFYPTVAKPYKNLENNNYNNNNNSNNKNTGFKVGLTEEEEEIIPSKYVKQFGLNKRRGNNSRRTHKSLRIRNNRKKATRRNHK